MRVSSCCWPWRPAHGSVDLRPDVAVDAVPRPGAPGCGGLMPRLLTLLTILLAAVLAPAAMATPTPSFTVSDSPAVGVPVTFDATATVCDAEPCGYTWRIIDGSRLGITFGRTPIATYTFDEPGLVQVQLRVVNSNPRIGGPSRREASLEQFITVAPATSPRCPDLFLVTAPGVPVAVPQDPCSHVNGDPNGPPE